MNTISRKRTFFFTCLLIISISYLISCVFGMYFLLKDSKKLTQAIHEQNISAVEILIPNLKRDLSAFQILTFGQLQSIQIVMQNGVSFLEKMIISTHDAQAYTHIVLNGSTQEVQEAYKMFYQSFLDLQETALLLNQNLKQSSFIWNHIPEHIRSYVQTLNEVFPKAEAWIEKLPSLMGPGHKTYLVLLQNNMEIRATGGFLGSFAIVEFENGVLSSLKVEDIYVPDGQFQAYVKPPLPVEKYLYQEGGWKLRDSNWNPNFPDAAQTILWFFDKGGYRNIDGVIAINFSFIQKILEITGPLYVPDYNQTVSAENFYSFAQVQTEHNFFPGATNKKNILGGLSRSFMRQIHDLPREQQYHVAKTILYALQNKDIMIWSQDVSIQKLLDQYYWSGKLETAKCKVQNCVNDTLGIFESNVGINKANCCMEREVVYDIWIDGIGAIKTTLTLHYVNHNPPTPDPPRFYGGGYKNYLRVYKDPEFVLHSVTQDSQTIAQIDQTSLSSLGLQEIGFLSEVPGGKQGDVILEFSHDRILDVKQQGSYLLFLQPQSGMTERNYLVRLHYPSFLRLHLQDYTLKKNEIGYGEFPLYVDKNTLVEFSFSRK